MGGIAERLTWLTGTQLHNADFRTDFPEVTAIHDELNTKRRELKEDVPLALRDWIWDKIISIF